MESDSLTKWPDWMPLAQQSDYNYEPTDRRTKTDMEVGSVLRVNFDTDETTLNCQIILNPIQSQWFEIFERDLQNQGSKWFEMPIQIANCIDWHTVRFATRPKVSIKAPKYQIYNFKLDIEKRKLNLCPEIAELLLCVTPCDIFNTANYGSMFQKGMDKLKVPDYWIYGCKNLEVANEFGM